MIMREISNHILDIRQNSVAAGATLVRTDISYPDDDKKLKVVITDNGKGMDEKTLASVEDPFSTSRKTRSVGLGIPLYKYHAILTGGDFSIKSKLGVGTCVKAVFCTDNIDCMPLGNLVDAILTTISSNHSVRFVFTFKVDDKSFEFDTNDVKDILHNQEGFCDLTVYFYLREFMTSNINKVNGGKLQL